MVDVRRHESWEPSMPHPHRSDFPEDRVETRAHRGAREVFGWLPGLGRKEHVPETPALGPVA
jgi:hypothetical protein